MAIPDSLETRLVDRVAWFFRANDAMTDFFELYGGVGTPSAPTIAARIKIGSFSTFPDGTSIIPPCMNIYVGNASMESGVGDAWPAKIEVVIEHFSRLNDQATEAGVRDSLNQAKEIVTRLYKGESSSPGRFKDPANTAVFLTHGIDSVQISEPRVGKSGILRFISAIFTTRQDKTGAKV